MTAPKPHIPTEGRVLNFDFPGLMIGVAEYEEGPTGCTVFVFDGAGLPFAADVRGGSTGNIGLQYGFAKAICFAGGSLMGLEAASGVAAEAFAERGHEHVDWNDVPAIAGAIIFDYGRRRTSIYPDRELGAAAYRAAAPGRFLLGRRGAGASASVGKLLVEGTTSEFAGQGAAVRQVGETKVAVFTVVNALGAVLDREGRVVRGNLDLKTGERRLPLDAIGAAASAPGNTTLTLLVTNQALDGRSMEQMARQVHASMARAIQPFHTSQDGDTLLAVSTRTVQGGPLADAAKLGLLASEVAWDAVLASFEGGLN
ncbi:MAG TPA: P1 family peptidase [Dehalococcoidia bacterium]